MINFEHALDALDGYFAKRMESDNIPGMALAITDRERTIRTRTLGVADLSSGTKVTKDTLFQIGSISKSFAAVALLQL